MFVLKEKNNSPTFKQNLHKKAKNFTCCFCCSYSWGNRSESGTSITLCLVILTLAEALLPINVRDSLWLKLLFNKIRISPDNSKDAREKSEQKRRCIFQLFFWLSWVEEKPILFILPATWGERKSRKPGRRKRRRQGRGAGRSSRLARGPEPTASSTGTEGHEWHSNLGFYLNIPRSISCMGCGGEDPFPAQLKWIRETSAAEARMAAAGPGSATGRGRAIRFTSSDGWTARKHLVGSFQSPSF